MQHSLEATRARVGNSELSSAVPSSRLGQCLRRSIVGGAKSSDSGLFEPASRTRTWPTSSKYALLPSRLLLLLMMLMTLKMTRRVMPLAACLSDSTCLSLTAVRPSVRLHVGSSTSARWAGGEFREPGDSTSLLAGSPGNNLSKPTGKASACVIEPKISYPGHAVVIEARTSTQPQIRTTRPLCETPPLSAGTPSFGPSDPQFDHNY
ncbi:unnamed protein product [Protopolystoma xenopodis]|uniref:Uncharacterized protein n=1 Tax=Protopolystoma xenopodis TaxID=117903 RepID=A0A3S5CST3_9PLAT|nr:unnamed protein product [Protopolystoma xenopodis]